MQFLIRRSLTLAVLGAILLTTSVQAATPDRQYLDVEDIFLPGGTVACDFDVLMDFGLSSVYGTTFTDQAGNVTMFAVNGNVEVSAVNLETGDAVPLIGSGPFRIFFDSAGDVTMIMATGHTIHWDPGLWVDSGRYDFSTGLSGTQTDICAALA
jgi:hypothetical protein